MVQPYSMTDNYPVDNDNVYMYSCLMSTHGWVKLTVLNTVPGSLAETNLLSLLIFPTPTAFHEVLHVFPKQLHAPF